jgi:hypothetical protein
MLGAIPAIALAVAARQIYLSKTEDLSTWKGGGMGMFAAADNAFGRYARIYMVSPTGERMPLWRLKPAQEVLLQKCMWFPSERNFRALADTIKQTVWWPGSEEISQVILNENGEKVGIDNSIRFHEFRAAPVRPAERQNLIVEMEYWKSNYDVATSGMKAELIRTFKFED